MKMRSKFLALLGAAVLTVGVVGVAFAEDLKEVHEGLTISWDENGDPVIEDAGGDPFPVNEEECDTEPGVGEIIVHFVQSGQGTTLNPDNTDPQAADQHLTVQFTGAADVGPIGADSVQGGAQNANVDWYAHTDATTDTVVLDTASSDVTGGELRVSHICVGDEPNFEQSQEGETPPPTDSIGGTGTSGPADGAWLLVVALGVLLASIVVLTPARAKSRR